MSNEEKKKKIALPDFLKDQDDNTRHIYLQWEAIRDKIDNYPGRFQTVSTGNGNTQELDLKAPPHITRKKMEKLGIDKSRVQEVMEVAEEMQKLKTKKANLNIKWKRIVFGAKHAEHNILSMRSSEVLDMFGRYYTVEEIRKVIQNDWGNAISLNNLVKFHQDNKEKIEKLKSQYVLQGKETRLATDAGRMEVLSKLAWEMEQKFDRGKSIEVSKELRAIVEQIRREVKGDEIKLTIDGKIDINATIQANKTLNEVLQRLPINAIVIGLVAAKRGLQPALLMHQLNHSYYSRLNGFNKLEENAEVISPAQFIKGYDWNEIKKKNKQIEIEDAQVVEEVVSKSVIDQFRKVEVVDKKQKMLDMLKEIKGGKL